MEGIGKERRCDEELARGRGDEEQQSTVEGAPFQPQPPFFNEINGGHSIALPKQHLVSSERSLFKRVLVERQHTHIKTSTAKACNWRSLERLHVPFRRGGWDSPGRTPMPAQFAGRATPSYMKANGFRPCMYPASSFSM